MLSNIGISWCLQTGNISWNYPVFWRALLYFCILTWRSISIFGDKRCGGSCLMLFILRFIEPQLSHLHPFRKQHRCFTKNSQFSFLNCNLQPCSTTSTESVQKVNLSKSQNMIILHLPQKVIFGNLKAGTFWICTIGKEWFARQNKRPQRKRGKAGSVGD